MRAIADSSAVPSKKRIVPEQMQNDLRPRVASDLNGHPKSLLIGTSRGGLVAGIALAKIGAEIWESGDDLQRISTLNSKFSCLGLVSAPSSVMMGKLRLILEYLIHDQLQFMPAKKLPGLRQLMRIFAPYIQDTTGSRELLENAGLEIQKEIFVSDTPPYGVFETMAQHFFSGISGHFSRT